MIATAYPLSTTLERPLKAYIPASVAIKGGTLIQAIQNPWKYPIRRPITSIASTAIHTLRPLLSITAPTPPAKQTTDPTARSMLPPVRIHMSIPVARTNTYAFCDIRLLIFCAYRILPSVVNAKNITTTMSARIIVYFWKKEETTPVFMLLPPSLT